MIIEELPDQECLAEPDENEVKPALRHWSAPSVEILKITHFRSAPAMKDYYYAPAS